MLAKKHEYNNQIVLAVCDKEHLGVTFEDGKLSFTVSKHFYGGDNVLEEEILELIKEASSANLFGNKCVDLFIREGLINERNVILIKGIKHAQIYNIENR